MQKGDVEHANATTLKNLHTLPTGHYTIVVRDDYLDEMLCFLKMLDGDDPLLT